MCKPWRNAIIVKLLGKILGFKALSTRVKLLWQIEGGFKIIDLGHDYFLFKFQKKEDYRHVLDGGPWIIGGHYLTVWQWCPNFQPDSDVINTIIAWVRLPQLPMEYYSAMAIRRITSRVGRVIRLDRTTETVERGGFTRVCVQLDLSKPLKAVVNIGSMVQKVEYEGLHLICFRCGQFGHRRDACPLNVSDAPAAATSTDNGVLSQTPSQVKDPPDAGLGPWMIVQRKGRRPMKETPAKDRGKADGEGSDSRNRSNIVIDAGKDLRNRYNPLNVVLFDSWDKAKELLSTAVNTSSKGVKAFTRKEWIPKKEGGIKIVSKSALKKGHKDKKKVDEGVLFSQSSLDKPWASTSFEPPVELLRLRVISAAIVSKQIEAAGHPDGEGVKSLTSDPLSLPQQHPPLTSNLVLHNGDLDMVVDKMDNLSKEDSVGVCEPLCAAMQGAANPDFRRNMLELIHSHHVDLLIIVEPRVSGVKADRIISRLRFDGFTKVDAVGFSGGIWVLWKSSIGLMNVVEQSDEKFGGRPEPVRRMEQFREVVDRRQLIDLDASGCKFTWSNKQPPGYLIKKKLDRALCNVHWRHSFSDAIVRNLPRAHSDHCPVAISVYGLLSRNPLTRPFRFEAAWQSHDSFPLVLSDAWNSAESLNHSLSHLREALGIWNKNTFGNIHRRKRLLMARLGGVQRALETRPNPFLYRLEKELSDEFNLVLSQEEMLWFQKSHSNWMVLSHFKSVYQAERLVVDFDNLCPHIRMPLNDEHVLLLSHIPHDDEIYGALKSMAPYKSPGPDRFQAAFYQANWEVVRESVCSFVRNAFITGNFEEELSRVLVVLIPKVESPKKVTQFRPISLCNVTVKLLSKLLVTRLRPMLRDLISPMQSSFIPGRGTTDDIVVLQEVIHTLSRRKGRVGGMVMKVDLEKAYDRISWDFLRWVLMDLDLPSTLINLIMFCITSTRMNILWNGELTKYFQPSRGLRQGDPLSPYLFVLCLQKLSDMIDSAVDSGSWKTIKMTRRGPSLSHIFFADDLKVNFTKSLVYFSPNVSPQLVSSVVDQTCMSSCDDLGRYLGVPLLHRRVSRHTYDHLVDRVKKRLASWKANSLSLAGRATLVQSVTSSMPVYTMQTSKLPSSVTNQIDSLNRDFLWGSTDDKKKVPLVKWDSVCQSKSSGGLGFRKLGMMNQALLAKMGWKLENEDPGETSMDIGWKKIWRLDVPPRVKHFLWLVRHGRLLTKLACFRRHITSIATCSRCGVADESVLHVLRDCGTSQSIWSRWLHGARSTVFIGWSKPPTGFVKVNVDAAARTNPGELAAGGICRNPEGAWIFGFTCKLGWGHILKAELYAIFHGMRAVWDAGYRLVIVESDSLVAVNKIMQPPMSQDPMFQVIHRCRELLQRDWQCFLVHTYREANMCADFLVSWAYQGSFDVTILDHPPGVLHHFIEEDIWGMSRPRAIVS
ncbi:reverse transcriptase [Corchorus capsularis]|uniref:Reverse transcriptase n=1 Tax=Corchorus capsularis TaxID=210143 RepID=A0A1R3HDZ6_COCAP|nr:reverse transcriptase [Corchorus capsularis]